MRRMLMVFSAVGLLQVALGCHHTGGKCDCGAQPGEAITYAPVSDVSSVRNGIPSGHVIGTPTSRQSMSPMPSTIETVPPREMPKR